MAEVVLGIVEMKMAIESDKLKHETECDFNEYQLGQY